MAPQDGLYAMQVRDGPSERARRLGAVQRVIVAPEEPQALLDALASPDTHVVTLTSTEKGYTLDPATGALRQDAPPLAAGDATPARPDAAPGELEGSAARP